MRLNEDGVLHVPLALLSLILILTGLGLWGILHHWNRLAQTQLRLDRCTGETALQLKSKLNTIAKDNLRMKELRTAEAAALAALQPQVASSLRLLVEAELVHQEATRAKWLMKQAEWALHSGCGVRGDISAPLPAMEWHREPMDELGPRPLRMEEFPKYFYIEARHHPRAAAAEVISGGQYGDEKTSWHARWAAPQGPLGAGLH